MTGNQPQIACQACGASTKYVGYTSRVGGQAGTRIFQCETCDHFTWIPWPPDDEPDKTPDETAR